MACDTARKSPVADATLLCPFVPNRPAIASMVRIVSMDGKGMSQEFANEVRLLRAITPHLELKPSAFDQAVKNFFRAPLAEGFSAHQRGLVRLLPPARGAFRELADALEKRFPEIARGTTAASLHAELFDFLADRVAGRQPEMITADDVRSLHDHMLGWFRPEAGPLSLFIPCAITPWAAGRFQIGPVDFVFIDHVTQSDWYPPVTPDDMLSRDSFDRILRHMRESHADWLACVPVTGCEPQRADELAALSVDLAIVALQLVAPNLGTRTMCRLDARRGAAQKITLSRRGAYYGGGWTRQEPGSSIGTGTLADILQTTRPVIAAVGNIVRSFASGDFRLPALERAWCDAAYWLHEALAEPIDSIAVTKLETAIEVLVRAESTSRSNARILQVLDVFYGLAPDDPIAPGSEITARKFAKMCTEGRSRVLHGTSSTLHARLASDRDALENFAIPVLRTAAVELHAYAAAGPSTDEIGAFLDWVRARRTAKFRPATSA